jgi:hypothetical protein
MPIHLEIAQSKMSQNFPGRVLAVEMVEVGAAQRATPTSTIQPVCNITHFLATIVPVL